jgi:hypothetical protein
MRRAAQAATVDSSRIEDVARNDRFRQNDNSVTQVRWVSGGYHPRVGETRHPRFFVRKPKRTNPHTYCTVRHAGSRLRCTRQSRRR